MMSRIFRGEADELKYYETTREGFRAVYESDEKVGLTLPKREITSNPVKIKIIRGYKFVGSSWHPHDITPWELRSWRDDIRTILGAK